VGPWLPEPLVTPAAPSPEARLELDASMSIAFLRMLERLSPEERAALLLRDVFDSTYPEIARILDKTETACRQLIHRARERVRRDRARFEVSQEEHRRLLDQFSAAMHTADESALRALFATHATVTSDGGGKAAAATRPVEGNDRVARLFAGVARNRGRLLFIAVSVNGEPGLVMWAGGRLLSVMAIRAEGGRILELYSMMNPDKLKHVETHPDTPGSGGFGPSQS
jgi:RNA polymerase sigma-70 factor (ECF subfamily)